MKRLICLLFGHDYRLEDVKITKINIITKRVVYIFKCKRCNKIKKGLQ